MKTIDRARFYVTSKIGEKRSTTPEGFLVCHDVPIARTGAQLYSPQEIPLDPGPDGLVHVERPPEEVFRDETVSSFEGKAVTVEHPNDFVTPENWQQLAVGTVQNVRRGSGIEDDLLIADLVITDRKAIEYVNKAMPEVSAGYEAAYEQKEPGRGVQRDIVGNHVALVERGRAGPRCSIKDEEMKMTKRTFWDRILTAVKAKDADAVKAEMESMDSEETEEEKAEREAKEKAKKTGDSIAALTATVDSLAKVVAKLVKDAATEEEETKDEESEEEKSEREAKEKKTDDTVLEAETAQSNPAAKGTVLSGDSLKAVIARAEILAPGITVPTGDSVKSTVAASFKVKALETAFATADGKKAIEPFLAGRKITALTGDALNSVFTGAAELMRATNNRQAARATSATRDFGKVTAVAEINALNREFWANRSTARN